MIFRNGRRRRRHRRPAAAGGDANLRARQTRNLRRSRTRAEYFRDKVFRKSAVARAP